MSESVMSVQLVCSVLSLAKVYERSRVNGTMNRGLARDVRQAGDAESPNRHALRANEALDVLAGLMIVTCAVYWQTAMDGAA
jgi:hypothetical protein